MSKDLLVVEDGENSSVDLLGLMSNLALFILNGGIKLRMKMVKPSNTKRPVKINVLKRQQALHIKEISMTCYVAMAFLGAFSNDCNHRPHHEATKQE